MELLLKTSVFKTSMASRVALVMALAALAAGCNTKKTFGDLTPGETLTTGYVLDPGALDMVPVGSSREQVLLALGSPSTTATFDNEVFYYVTQTRRRSVAFAKPRVVDQRVLAVYFGADGRVTQIAHYGLKDGKVFDFLTRTTPTGGRDRTFLSQMLAGGAGTGNMAKGLLGG